MAKKKSYNQRDETSGEFESKAEALAEPNNTQRERRRPLSDSGRLYNRLTRAIRGLAYRSESPDDSPLKVFKGSEVSKSGLTKEEMLAQISRAANTPIEERDFNRLFENIVDDTDAPEGERVGKLKSLMEANLTDIHVFVVPSKSKAATKKVFIVGIDSDDNVTGLRCGGIIET